MNNFAGLQTFPLTSITATAKAAYSLRQLNCAYSGPAITIRSTAVGNPTTNIGFTPSGDLDTAAIKSFVGTASAYVTIWYDQSGNALHVSQAASGSQPRIANAGVIARQNGKPAVNFVGGASVLFRNALMMSDKISVSIIAKLNNPSVRNALFDLSTTSGSYPDFVIEANTFSTLGNRWGLYANNNSLDGSAPTSTNLTLMTIIAQNTYSSALVISNTNFYVNGATSTLSCRSCVTTVYRSSWPNGFTIGNFNSYPVGLDGFISEMIVFPSALSNTEREFLEWSQSQYYNINTGVALGTRPGGTLPEAFVTTWYDQSGNGRHVSQTTNSSQPRIINSGFLEKLNSLPAIYFNGTSHVLSGSDAGLPTGNLAIEAVVRSNASSLSSGNYACFLHYGSSGNGNAMFGTFGTDGNLGTNAVAVSQYGDGVGVNNSLSTNLIYSTGRVSTNYYLFTNGTNATSKTMATSTSLYGAGGLTIGSTNPSLPGSFLSGMISEVTIFPVNLSNTRRILTETNRSAYNNIAISNSKYSPPSLNNYNLFVNGIGRESATDTVLGTRNTVGLGFSSALSTADFLQSDGDYITAGINCPVGPGTSLTNLPPTISQRWSNDWYVNKTDLGTTGGNLKLYFDFSDYGVPSGFLPGIASNYELLYRNSPSASFTIVSGTTKNVVGDRVEFVIDASLITNNYYFTIGTKNIAASPLPVELIYFNAVAVGSNVELAWATATEKNNNYFLIQKTKNGNDFSDVKKVDSKSINGNSFSRHNYSDIDIEPYEGTSYYRLQMVDLDGQHTYSNLVAINFGNDNNIGFSIYPNPNDGEFVVSFSGLNNYKGDVKLTLNNALGNVVFEKHVLISEDVNIYTIEMATKIPKGFYVLSCSMQDKLYQQKVIVN